MSLFKKASEGLILTGILSVLAVPFSYAATNTSTTAPVAPAPSPAKTAAPDPNANPILSPILKMGAKAYYLGNRSGLDGWFVMKDNRVQIVYTTADNQTLIIGAMFGPNGENISGSQANELFNNNKELSTSLTAAIRAVTGAGVPSTNLPTPPAIPSAAGVPVTGNTPSSVTASAAVSTALSPGERLIQDLTNASGVDVGYAAAPRVLMVMDPNCPHCQATWRLLRVAIFKNNLRVRLVPIAPPDSDDERAAAQLLQAGDPLGAWDKYVAGDKTQLAGTPDKALITAVQANHELIDSWSIQATPYLVYRAKDGKVKIVEGEPDKIDPILSDLTP